MVEQVIEEKKTTDIIKPMLTVRRLTKNITVEHLEEVF